MPQQKDFDRLLDYYMAHTDERLDRLEKTTKERFDKIEAKVDQLITFRLMLLGGAMGVSSIVTIIVNIVIFLIEQTKGR